MFDDDRRLEPGEIAAFALDGHAVVRNLATAEELAPIVAPLLAAAEARRFDRRPLDERDTYGKAFVQSANLWEVDPIVAGLTMGRRFAHVAAQLLGVDGVRLYHDQALIKEPGGGHTPWHQDQNYWPLDTDRTITMWMALDDIPAEIGSMTFASGTHRLGELGEYAIGDESQDHFENYVIDHGIPRHTHGPMDVGDATFHTGWTLHSAGANRTDRDRPVMTVIYFADGTRVIPEIDNVYRRLDLMLWLPGCEPGGPAISEKNPLLWSVGGVT